MADARLEVSLSALTGPLPSGQMDPGCWCHSRHEDPERWPSGRWDKVHGGPVPCDQRRGHRGRGTLYRKESPLPLPPTSCQPEHAMSHLRRQVVWQPTPDPQRGPGETLGRCRSETRARGGSGGGGGPHGAQGPVSAVREAPPHLPPCAAAWAWPSTQGPLWPHGSGSARGTCCSILPTRPQPEDGRAGHSTHPTPRPAGFLMRHRELLWAAGLRHEGRPDGDFVTRPPQAPGHPYCALHHHGCHDAIRGGSCAGTPSVGGCAFLSGMLSSIPGFSSLDASSSPAP